MSFQFVDNNATINGAARRRIRSHVAMGRNAGKKIARPSRKEAFGQRIKTSTTLIRIPKVIEDIHDSESSGDILLRLGRQVGDGLSVLSFPEQLTAGSKGLVQKAFAFISGPRYVPELNNTLDSSGISTSIWVRFMFMDEAYFHCAIALSVTALNNLLIKQEDPKEAMRHLSHTFRIVNERLSGDGTVSDTTIAVVVSMTQYDRLRGQYREGIVHVDGLLRMVELRGGISQLMRDNSGLAEKILRADLDYSLHLGSATRFRIGDVLPHSKALYDLLSSPRQNINQKAAEALGSQFLRQLSADLQTLLLDITGLAWLLNEAGAGYRPKVNAHKFHSTLIQLGFHLVGYSPLGAPRPLNRLENAVHLGLMAFIMTFLRGLDHKVQEVPLLLYLARSAAQEPVEDWLGNEQVLLWLLFIWRASIFSQADDTWLVPQTTRTMRALGLLTWEDVGQTLARFPWVSAVHDKAGQALCHRAVMSFSPVPEITSNLPVIPSTNDARISEYL